MGHRLDEVAKFRATATPTGAAALKTVTRFEWANAAYRVLNVVGTFIVFPENRSTWLFYVVVLLTNLALYVVSRRGKGPLTRGRPGVVFEIMHSVSAMILVAVFLPDRTYLSEDAAAPFATYAAGVAGLVVLLPRHAVQGGRLRRLVGHGADLLLPLTLYPVFTAAAFLNGYSFGELDFGFLTLQVSWTLVGVLLGYLILGLSRAFVDAEVEILRNTYESFSDWLHSEIKGDIAAMRGMLSQDEIDRARLTRVADDLERKVGAERLRLLLGDEELSVADILAHNIERFAGAIRYDRIPAVGGWVVSNRAGLMLNRVLGDLLSNAVKADAVRVTIDMARDDSRLSVTIADDGPGFDASVLDDDSTSLGRLRRDLERDRGALAKIPTDSGSIVAAVLRWGE